jgi:hypothetical protein
MTMTTQRLPALLAQVGSQQQQLAPPVPAAVVVRLGKLLMLVAARIVRLVSMTMTHQRRLHARIALQEASVPLPVKFLVHPARQVSLLLLARRSALTV